MSRLLLIITFCYFLLPSFGQFLKETSRMQPLQPGTIALSDSTTYFSQPHIISPPLTGCLCDPVIQNKIGFSLVSDFRKPLPAIMLDMDPIYFARLNSDLLIRYNFCQELIINSGLETKYIILRMPLNIRVEYKSYHLPEANLNDYQKYLSGLVYRIRWTKITLLTGLDCHQHQKNLGSELYFDYEWHIRTGKCCEFNRLLANFSTGIGYWGNRMNYRVKLNYFIHHGMALGFEYEKLFNFNEFRLSVRFLNLRF